MEILDSVYKRGFYWIADNPKGKILASGSYKEVKNQIKNLKNQGLLIDKS